MIESQTSIAVLPFRNLSVEEDTEYFARGFVDDLTTELTRFAALRVLSSQTAFQWEAAFASLAEFGGKWDVDVVLQGSVRRDRESLRVGVQLIRISNQETIWAERFDAPLEQVFEIQDSIVARVAGQLAIQVDESRLRIARRDQTDSLPLYDYWLRGMDCLKRGTLEGDEEAREYFQQALKINESYARAYVGLSLSHFNEWSCQAWHLWQENGKNAYDYALKSAQLDDRDAMVYSVLSRVCRFRHQHQEANQYAERALSLNPNDAHVLIQVAISKLFGGEPEQAHELAKNAISLNPLHGNWYHGIVGWCLFMMKRFKEAHEWLLRAGNVITDFAAYRAACAIQSGNTERARAEYQTFQQEYSHRIVFGAETNPEDAIIWAIQVEPFRRLQDSRLMPEILAEVGLVEVDVEKALKSRTHLQPKPAEVTRPAKNEFLNAEGLWTVSYEGTGAQLVEVKGFHDLALLLSQPGESVHCLELSGRAIHQDAPDSILDDEARRDYRRRIQELQHEIEEAEADNDPARLDPAQSELDALFDQLAQATGLGGRDRKLANPAEKARSAVTWRIRSAIKKIQVAHPRLGQHLSNSIRTGYFCAYFPEAEISWEL